MRRGESSNFKSLSIRTLLEARDLYHFHLMSKANVVGTAVGLYLIRKDESYPTDKGEKPKKLSYPRNLDNSEVRPYSWPCILVFVRRWADENEFGPDGGYHPTDIVPKTLFMPDGRAVPVCIVEAGEDNEEPAALPPQMSWPRSWLGGGLPISVEVQGERRWATAGCLVTDGHLTYALTARHACGEEGTPVFAETGHGTERIGASASRQLTRMPFSEVYPAFPGRQSYVSLDVGLVRLDDVNDWTSSAYGLPAVGPLADVYEQNLGLDLIDRRVVLSGAASGVIDGRIKGLFYRHRSVGGYDYVGDFLIAPASGSAPARPGDSGAVWHLLERAQDLDDDQAIAEGELRPLAVEWGGQILGSTGVRTCFAVATSLSNVCKLLDVELVTDADRGVQGYWGRVGHYSIATFAVGMVEDADLKTLLDGNLTNISFDWQTLREGNLNELVRDPEFVALADVPDEVWKKYVREPGGRDPVPRKGPEHPTHYADIDVPLPGGGTLMSICRDDPAKINVEFWRQTYAELADHFERSDVEAERNMVEGLRDPWHQGLLPFRIWQFYDAMVAYLQSNDAAGFIAAAGTLAHYVGDACQPLHGSMYADGDPYRTVDRLRPQSGRTETVRYASGIHSAYETKMLDRFKGDILTAAGQRLPANHGLPLATSGHEAASATIRLMASVADIIDPKSICDRFEELGGKPTVPVIRGLWEDYGSDTVDVMVLGARTLAMIYDGAWRAGGGLPAAALAEVPRAQLRALYVDRDFVPSLSLDKIGDVLR